MKLLIILPNWLGDALMATAAIESLCECYPQARLTLVGSYVAIEALKHHPMCVNAYVDETKKGGNRLANTYRFAKTIGRHDAAVSFRNQLHASLLLRWTGTPRSVARASWHARLLLSDAVALSREEHLTAQYQRLADRLCGTETVPGPLRLFIPPHTFERPTLGINPGATYGSAKRWYPEKFAAVAAHFADRYDIVIFGGPGETAMAEAIEKDLQARGVGNYRNLAGKTTITELCAAVGGLSLFVTNDSGPMHVAAAYRVPTVAIFGPTRHKETCQWGNPKSAIVRHDMECAPCMKRECPLKHHECMKSIEAYEVIEAAEKLIV
ncbi:lipopolysaccharide heptosyltransferase II [Sulfurimonas sp. HSL-3221]|uniref:lipopolysaccharide heptosyltransferase II n=1 Tax=Sulfurimonadaceae TaxID=2771471 RepID=UPI001E38CE7A|nr:lipopolysaccharide heptosyltransferase II [Sulfurimonas sp. HSL-3221]UFS62217.1 lipopolysaccharide heptosyltransferase II [Sulfurimonas sp. HSL-3221]